MLLVTTIGLATAVLAARQGTPPPLPFQVEETTIAAIHEAMKGGTLTCRALIEQYLRRIDAYDKNGPAVNAIVQVNPDALKTADEFDRRFKASGPVGRLHCIPTIVKDNFETIGLQSAAGSLALKGFVSQKDAFQVKKIREAGAIVLAKSNMAEWAFTPYETVSSILPGYTKNPYALDRVTAGSSGGTAAAVAANMGAVGLGSDTGNSIRGPSSHQALVGIRSTMGWTSRAGVIPLSSLADVAGPMTRTVADAVAVFQTIAQLHFQALDDTGLRRRHFHARLVRLKCQDALVGFDTVADLHKQFNYFTFTAADVRYANEFAHRISPQQSSGLSFSGLIPNLVMASATTLGSMSPRSASASRAANTTK